MSTSNRVLPSEPRAERVRALQRSAIRQTATLRAASAAVIHAPTLDDCAAAMERARDELEQLERSNELYRELTDAELTDAIASEVRDLPLPASWFEAALAQLVLCLAARIEATQHDAPPSKVSALQLVRECEHVDAARAALREPDGSAPVDLPPERVDRWLRIAIDSLAPGLRATYLSALRGDIAALGVRCPAGSLFAA